MRQQVERYLAQVTQSIRSTKARAAVEQELTYHFEQRIDALMSQGYQEQEAEAKVIEGMGNPLTVGQEMAKIHKPTIDWLLLSNYVMILGLGVIIFYVITFPSHINHMPLFSRQLIFGTIGLAITLLIMFINYRYLLKWWYITLVMGGLLTITMELFGSEISGRPFIFLFNWNINNWFTMLFYLLGFAGLLNSRMKQGKLYSYTTLMYWLPIYFFIDQVTFLIAVFYFITLTIMVLFANLRWKEKLTIMTVQLATGLAFAVYTWTQFSAYVQFRLSGFFFPNEQGDPYLYLQIRQLFKESTMLGNRSEWGGYELVHTELIFPYLVNRLGWLFGAVLLSLLILLLGRLVKIGWQTKDPFGQTLVVLGTTVIGLSIVWNTGMMFGLLPIAGVPLPFISYGGQFTVIFSIYIGLILSVNRKKQLN
ncbi:cell division protein FtsW, lipid II flippase [Amphibacillus marinus]|uniref:Cell division protein FtsW, lipid II flippase n=1 Tax=Amphibacillus marinus TaxID=872970 RepID=A0A1H8NBX0_9BACI|nr:FtsW/RodA/SpoVE family cell cycle protein [Amphibacillus marinus]SEO27052.1 cell division protein FtsW, lipid II flippase [Amphibacillus marinus]